jgi:hypothetical protein
LFKEELEVGLDFLGVLWGDGCYLVLVDIFSVERGIGIEDTEIIFVIFLEIAFNFELETGS